MSASPRFEAGDVTLLDLLRRAAAEARHRPVLATYVEPLPGLEPLDAFERAGAAADRVYWARPSTGVAVAGIGAAATIAPAGEQRFAAAARLWQALLAGAICDGPGALGADSAAGSLPMTDAVAAIAHPATHPAGSAVGDELIGLVRDTPGLAPESAYARGPRCAFGRRPMLLGGFRFDPARPPAPEWLGFPDSWLMVPRLCLAVSPAGRWLATSVLVKPGNEPARLADSLERERERLLGVGRAATAATAWAAIADSMRGRGEANRGGAMLTSNSAHADAIVAGRDPVREGVEDAPADACSARTTFMRAVADGAAAVREGALEKVVTARSVAWRPHETPDAATALRRLEERHPECNIFAVARGRRVFLGASPERLVRVDGRTVRTTSLAGSTARGSGPEEDARRGAELMESAKDREEHDIVVRALTAALAELCDAVGAPAAPTLLTLPDVHHLYTPITARRREGTDLLRLLERLHPTPAVGGAPREKALAFIREHEGWDRGWYAAPVGWTDASGDGEFAVALRSALMDGDQATLFAGCGIVADSVPGAEYAESELKLRAMREALTGDAAAGDAVAADAAAGEEARES